LSGLPLNFITYIPNLHVLIEPSLLKRQIIDSARSFAVLSKLSLIRAESWTMHLTATFAGL
jgi:hypothetical protein